MRARGRVVDESEDNQTLEENMYSPAVGTEVSSLYIKAFEVSPEEGIGLLYSSATGASWLEDWSRRIFFARAFPPPAAARFKWRSWRG